MDFQVFDNRQLGLTPQPRHRAYGSEVTQATRNKNDEGLHYLTSIRPPQQNPKHEKHGDVWGEAK